MFLGTGLPYGEGPDVLYMHGQWEMTEGHFDPGFPGGSGPAIWYRVALPADLGVDPPRANLIRAYRFRLDVPESFDLDELLGIHLGPVQAAAQAWLNGSLVGQTGDVDGLDVPAFRESRVYALPAGVLHHGVNEVVLRIRNVIPHAHGPRGNHPAVGPLAKMYRMGRIESMPTLVLGCMLLGLGLFHLILTQADLRAHGLRSFALATAAMGVMSLLEVRWLFGLTLPQAVVERMLHMIVFSVPVLLFNFFCSSMVQAKNCPTLYRVSRLGMQGVCLLRVHKLDAVGALPRSGDI